MRLSLTKIPSILSEAEVCKRDLEYYFAHYMSYVVRSKQLAMVKSIITLRQAQSDILFVYGNIPNSA